MKLNSLGLKIALVVTAIIAIMIVLTVSTVSSQTDELVQNLTGMESMTANHALQNALAGYQDEALSRARMIALSHDVAEAIIHGNTEELKQVLIPYSGGVDLITIVDPEGTVLLRTHNDTTGDNLMNQKALSTALNTGTGIALIEKGSQQMDDMMNAVNEINDASKSISNVIKTIDDIAFQTNILALNAAVEAARAGSAGKGFAVVAEEVRNLAAKSAEAAKDTSGLIENSISKANTGVQIAGETAQSLSEIVTGINESTQLVSEIAKSSQEQSEDISQINTGIDQVTEVVQRNSATAEQSAAASEEMSGQSSILQQLISQFKIDDSSSRSLPGANPAGNNYLPSGREDA